MAEEIGKEKPEIPQKRGRGRPRKNPLPETQAVEQPKRPRGRPRKNPEAPAPEPQKRGRGRPRKNPPPPTPADAPKPTPVPRGRPRKVADPSPVRPSPSAPPPRRPVSDEDIHRLRTRELASALDYELRGFEDCVDDILEEIQEDLALLVASLRSELRRVARESSSSEDGSPAASRIVQKAAMRLSKFRDVEDVSLSDLAQFQRRLEKTLERLRRA